MRRKTELWVVGAFVLLVIVGGIVASMFSSVPASSGFQATTAATITSSDWARGNAHATVSVIEYGDFECPACGAYEPTIEQLTKQYGATVLFVFRNFPLYQIHPNARISAQAAEAAGVQGKYWEMHDLLYAKQSEWGKESTNTVVSTYFDRYAKSIGLNVQQFDTDINSSVVKDKVQKDLDSGTAAGVDHTPTFFINLTQIPNPNSVQEFQTVINAALASSTAQ